VGFRARYFADRHAAMGFANMAQLSSGISKGIFGAIALSLTFGAVASGRDLGQRDASSQINATQINSTEANSTEAPAAVNRSAKADRAPRVAGPVTQTQTVSLRLDGLADTSVLIRMPAARVARGGAPASLLTKSGSGRTLACEPVVSVLTDVAKRLQPGSCVT
jgi:hypothetical protein